jgi:hypothetical protein
MDLRCFSILCDLVKDTNALLWRIPLFFPQPCQTGPGMQTTVSYYHIPPDRKPFQTCLTECSDLGMSLAAPRNQAELTFLMDNFLNNWTDYEKKVWIGLDDLQQEGIDWEAL